MQARAAGQVFLAQGGKIIHVLEVLPGRFNVVVDGTRAYITSYRHMAYKKLVQQTCKWGWYCPL
jgi:hypothetical protein